MIENEKIDEIVSEEGLSRGPSGFCFVMSLVYVEHSTESMWEAGVPWGFLRVSLDFSIN